VSHILKFGDASKSPARDVVSPSIDAVVSHWSCIISFRDAHPPHSRERCDTADLSIKKDILIIGIIEEKS
jgi:hypothetical protein